jgi:hypothetical protein
MAEIRTGNECVQATPRAAPFGRRTTDLDPFLFAPIGEERNGMLLSVLSALARLDMDPWQEAASLMVMPTQDATARLTCLLSSSPSCTANPPGPRTIAGLIALLPQAPTRKRGPHGIAWGRGTSAQWIIAVYFLMTFLMMCAEQFIEGRHAPVSGESRAAEHSQDALPSPALERNSAGGQ